MRFLSLILVICIAFSGFAQNETNLEGSWELKSYVNHQEGAKDWSKNPSSILYQKHISGDYFTWIKFDTNTKTLLGMGGGSYQINKNGKYVENLDFFYPPGSSELGQTIPFDVQMKGKEWFHTGYAKVFDIGIEGESVVVDSTKIEEVWKPVKGKGVDSELVGTWELAKYMETSQTGYMVFPEMIGYIKILTPTHFVWIKYDKEGDQIFAAASGTYKVTDSGYSETILMHYPESQLVGTSINFQKEISGNSWKHVGSLKWPDGKSDLIDEFWRPLIENQDSDDLDIN